MSGFSLSHLPGPEVLREFAMAKAVGRASDALLLALMAACSLGADQKSCSAPATSTPSGPYLPNYWCYTDPPVGQTFEDPARYGHFVVELEQQRVFQRHARAPTA